MIDNRVINRNLNGGFAEAQENPTKTLKPNYNFTKFVFPNKLGLQRRRCSDLNKRTRDRKVEN